MLKRTKLSKLRREIKAHEEAKNFCIQKQMELSRTPEFSTAEGEAEWEEYDRRYAIHREACRKALKEYIKLSHTI